MSDFPPDFTRTITATFGAEGRSWLERLPALIQSCAERWALTLEAPFDLSYNYVAPATRADGSEVVLKVGSPSRESATELAALRLYAGRGIVRLLDYDLELGAMLLERLRPGTMLAELEDDERATLIAADVMARLWRPVPAEHPFPSMAEYTSGLNDLRPYFAGGSGPFPAALVERAERLADELLRSMAEPVVLHGDLHHFNILSAEREPWLALDPKGVVGEPACEVGAFLHNPWPQLGSRGSLRRILHRRVDILAERLGLERERIRGWGIAYGVLAAWWSFDEASGTLDDWGEKPLACAAALAEA
jgi:streptomycin 6-kinase